MPEAITGTNTVKVDAVVQELASLKTTNRILLGAIGAVFVPAVTAIVMLTLALGELRADIREIKAELRAVNDRLGRIEKIQEEQAKAQKEDRERIIKLEAEMRNGRKP